MSTKTISITEEAYLRLKSLKSSEKDSFSEVIIRYFPARKRLSDVLEEIGVKAELADSIELASKEMRQAKMREAEI
jgi:predicted CopG family antitoxin